MITNGNPRCEPPLSIIHDILDGYDRPSRDHVLPDRAKAIAWALDQANAEDTILVTGNEPDPRRVYNSDQPVYDDRDIIRSCLSNSNNSPPGSSWFVPLVRG